MKMQHLWIPPFPPISTSKIPRSQAVLVQCRQNLGTTRTGGMSGTLGHHGPTQIGPLPEAHPKDA